MPNRIELKREAILFRSQHGYNNSDSINTHSLLEKLNVVTIFKKMSENFSGMAAKIQDTNFILINAGTTIGRQNFTIMHELYHLFIQKEFTSMICSPDSFSKKDGIEYNADWFAAFALIPQDGVLSMIPSAETSLNQISIETIFRIEEYFQCSRKALLTQLKEMGLIDSNNFVRLKKNIQREAEKRGYNTDLYKPGHDGLAIGNYVERVKSLYDEGTISWGLQSNLLSYYEQLLNFRELEPIESN